MPFGPASSMAWLARFPRRSSITGSDHAGWSRSRATTCGSAPRTSFPATGSPQTTPPRPTHPAPRGVAECLGGPPRITLVIVDADSAPTDATDVAPARLERPVGHGSVEGL